MPDNISLTKDELFEIALLCQLGFERFTVADDNTLKRIWDKVKPTLSDEDIAEIKSLVMQELKEIYETFEYHEVDPVIFQQVKSALSQGQRLRIRYHAHTTGETTERVVRPYEIADESIGPYFSAFCELRGADRLFRLDAIEEILEVLPQGNNITPEHL
ncbi:MAG: WYL domain-containing protein [Gemmatimonadota bacterium]|nr:MAG: WYL domain-containing protein [Gemmatimonadota bacterium]